MDAVKRLVKTYGGYDELWSDGGSLSIRYHREREYEVLFDGSAWYPTDTVGEDMQLYLCSAAAFADAYERCLAAGYEISRIYEFIPKGRKLLPEELLRLLMDDCGLGIREAVGIVLRCFGKELQNRTDIDRLFEIQPRTAALAPVLSDFLQRLGCAFHDSYDEDFRCPAGSVENGTEVRFSIASFGGVAKAELILYGDELSITLPMEHRGNMFTCTYTPDTPAALWYRFHLYTDDGEKWLCPDSDGHCGVEADDGAEGFRFTVYLKGFETPEWFRSGIMYQIFPDRFGFSHDGTAEHGIEYHRALGQTPQLHGSISEAPRWQAREGEADYAPDDFYGGTLKGITAKLPYLKGLGISIIYLNPIVEARSNHRYDTSDYSRVDPILGSNSDYVNLCAEAEGLGIRIINDGVFSHTGADSVYFNRFGNYDSLGACQGESSEYYPWYSFRSFPADYKCWWDFKDLPEVNELDDRWQNYIVSGRDSVVRKWLRMGASGWRIDVADELPDEVLGLIRKCAKEEKPDALILGEVWEDAVLQISYGKRRNYALGHSLDTVMNYPFRTAVLDFARGKADAYELRDFLLNQQHNYPKPMYPALMNLLGTHDVERLHTVLALDYDIKSLSRSEQAKIVISEDKAAHATSLQKLCAAIQYFVPGVPCLYYGDEECLDGGRDPFNRAPFEPSCDGLHNFYARLAEIRNSSPVFKYGDIKISTPSPDVIIMSRQWESVRFACVINRSGSAFTPPFTAAPLLSGNIIVQPCSAEIFRFT